MTMSAIDTHLASWIGAWPPPSPGLHVVATEHRDRPGWDGAVRPLLGAVDADGAGLVAVSPRFANAVTALLQGRPAAALDDPDLCSRVGHAVAGPGTQLGRGVLRWATQVNADIEEVGVWRAWDDPIVPAWLAPFRGEALLALDEDGAYAGGVGIKRHDATGHELSVVTDAAHRGQGLARRLVATAARHHLSDVPLLTYLHDSANTGSARVADAVGFPDRGWGVLGVWGSEAAG
jgi:GNAT superfamily N-acetyltransferase